MEVQEKSDAVRLHKMKTMQSDNVVRFYAPWESEEKTPEDIEEASGTALTRYLPHGRENNGVCRNSYVRGCS